MAELQSRVLPSPMMKSTLPAMKGGGHLMKVYGKAGGPLLEVSGDGMLQASNNTTSDFISTEGDFVLSKKQQ
jgi:hypothetical protein